MQTLSAMAEFALWCASDSFEGNRWIIHSVFGTFAVRMSNITRSAEEKRPFAWYSLASVCGTCMQNVVRAPVPLQHTRTDAVGWRNGLWRNFSACAGSAPSGAGAPAALPPSASVCSMSWKRKRVNESKSVLFLHSSGLFIDSSSCDSFFESRWSKVEQNNTSGSRSPFSNGNALN